MKVNWNELDDAPVPGTQVAPTPSRHLELKEPGPEDEVAVWNAVSLLVHTTVLFTPITTVRVKGWYPNRVVLPGVYPWYGVAAPETIVTFTQVWEVEQSTTAEVDDVVVLFIPGATTN